MTIPSLLDPISLDPSDSYVPYVRRRNTPAQLSALHRLFEATPHPTRAQRQALANEIGMYVPSPPSCCAHLIRAYTPGSSSLSQTGFRTDVKPLGGNMPARTTQQKRAFSTVPRVIHTGVQRRRLIVLKSRLIVSLRSPSVQA
jgi:hypothetical protein